MIEIKLIDVAAEARKLYGPRVNEVVGQDLPETDYRFELRFGDGRRTTMHAGATADDVVAYMAAN